MAILSTQIKTCENKPFVRSGYLHVPSGSIRTLAINGDNIAKTAVDYSSLVSANVYHFSISSTDVYTATGPYSRWHAYPIRCLNV